MKQNIKFILLTAIIILTNNLMAQDTLYLKQGTPVICKITEIGEDEVKYIDWDFLDGPMYSVAVTKINYIKFANGKEKRFDASNALALTGPSDRMMKKRDAIKIAPFNILSGNLVLGYEHVQKFGLHWEGEIGGIGLGKTYAYDGKKSGVFVSAGPKMILRKETYTKGERYLHYFHGGYFRPELSFEHHVGKVSFYDYMNGSEQFSNYTLVNTALMLNVGKQWLLADIMTLDIFAGLGMASTNIRYESAPEGFAGYNWNVRPAGMVSGSNGNGGLGLAARAGLKLGVIF